MKRTHINPWTWQDQFDYSQAVRVEQPRAVIYVSGQVSLDDRGELVGAGDFDEQCRQTFRNIQRILEQSEASLRHIVKLTCYLPDMANLDRYMAVKKEYLTDPHPASATVEVKGLAYPELMIEVEAIAAV